MVMFELDSLREILDNTPVHTWEGTCELCNFPRRKLSEVGGVLCCDNCRNTIAKRLKEANHPFSSAEAKMDPALAGPGPSGQRTSLTGQPGLSRTLKEIYEKQLLKRSRM